MINYVVLGLKICSFITNISSALRWTNWATVLMLSNSHYSKLNEQIIRARRLHCAFLLIYLLVYRIGLRNDVMRDAAFPWYQQNDAITVPKKYVSSWYLAALNYPNMFSDITTVHYIITSETKILWSIEWILSSLNTVDLRSYGSFA